MALPVPEWVSALWPIVSAGGIAFVMWRREENKKAVETAGVTATVRIVKRHSKRIRLLETNARETRNTVESIDARTEKTDCTVGLINNSVQQIIGKLDEQNRVRDSH